MSIFSLEYDGLDEYIRALEKLPDEITAELKIGLQQAAEALLVKTKAKVPVLSSELQNSLKTIKPKLKKDYMMSGVTFSNPKGVPIELGHRVAVNWPSVGGAIHGEAAARPFLRPAFDESKEAAEDIIVAAFNRALDKMGGKK